MPSKRRRAVPARATRAEVAAYANAHPGELESLAEMLPEERAEHVARMRVRSLSDTELLAKVRATGGDPKGVASLENLTARVAGPLGRANDLPIPVHGDSLRQELTDLLGMLSHLQELIPQKRPEAAMQQAVDCYALVRSILGD